MTMVDRVIDAIKNVPLDFADGELLGMNATREDVKMIALAALGAMEEPTEAMIEAAYEAEIGEPPEAAWKPMIQAAINEGVK